MSRRYSEQEIDEAVLSDQHRRQDERLADPAWACQPDEWTAALGGGAWIQIERED